MPVAIWLLGSVAVGLITWGYSERRNAAAARLAHDRDLRRVQAEIIGRLTAVYRFFDDIDGEILYAEGYLEQHAEQQRPDAPLRDRYPSIEKLISNSSPLPEEGRVFFRTLVDRHEEPFYLLETANILPEFKDTRFRGLLILHDQLAPHGQFEQQIAASYTELHHAVTKFRNLPSHAGISPGALTSLKDSAQRAAGRLGTYIDSAAPTQATQSCVPDNPVLANITRSRTYCTVAIVASRRSIAVRR